MPALHTVAEIVDATGGRAIGVRADAVSAISIDSREIAAGALFVAITGERFDGHDFVATALAKGAAAALVSEARAGDLPQEKLIVVPDALQGLVDLARAARARFAAKIVAVTGSAGKTTTKEAIRTVFEAAGQTHASIKSFNNHWGVPLMLARLPRTAAFAVFEIGMNHAGEITPLAQLVRPHVAVITTVAAAHLEFFTSVADIARAKAEIFSGLEPGGVALLNADHAHLDLLRNAAETAGVGRVVTYGFAETADWRIETVHGGEAKTLVDLSHSGVPLRLRLKVQGRHMAANAVAALAVANECGIDPDTAIAALAEFGAPEGRGAAVRLGDPAKPLVLIDESYNANAASMQAALEVFARQRAPGGKKVLVLGDMLELGEAGPALHAALKAPVLAAGADAVFLVGSNMTALAAALGPSGVAAHAQSRDHIADAILNSLAYGDAVMIKGSNGVGLGGLVRKIREKFA